MSWHWSPFTWTARLKHSSTDKGQVSSWDFGRTWNRKRQCGAADLGCLDPDGEEEEEGGDVDDDGQAEAAVEEEGVGGPDVRPPPVHVCGTGSV